MQVSDCHVTHRTQGSDYHVTHRTQEENRYHGTLNHVTFSAMCGTIGCKQNVASDLKRISRKICNAFKVRSCGKNYMNTIKPHGR
ncbi:hypothetical protein DPMN_162185 [Dreissena polymorpha]|uniref:Uncharacterized protein n=1 Tax=Dreissena polymorpha TaxID=45954 RepID=A0A9D4EUL9_DREPO|nr:hypothetical protein DPMN_162185 [Dreissena polymorpha]